MKEKREIQYISTRHAATLSGVTIATIRNWIETYGIGVKIGGRWKVDYAKLQILLKGYTGQMDVENAKERIKTKKGTNSSRANRGNS